jgi:hypothetical protein
MRGSQPGFKVRQQFKRAWGVFPGYDAFRGLTIPWPFALHQRRKPGHQTGRAEWSRESLCGGLLLQPHFRARSLARAARWPKASGQRRGDLGDWFKCPALSLGDAVAETAALA